MAVTAPAPDAQARVAKFLRVPVSKLREILPEPDRAGRVTATRRVEDLAERMDRQAIRLELLAERVERLEARHD